MARSASVIRRMPPGGNPEPSREDEAGTIELERRNRSTPSDGRPVDARCVVGPFEVVFPALRSRVEDLDERTRLRIDNEDAATLVIVAERAGEPEILFRRRTAKRSRNEMIDLHWPANDPFLSQAVPAAMQRLLRHPATQLDPDVLRAHRVVRSLETSCPRSFNSLAACARISMVRSYS